MQSGLTMRTFEALGCGCKLLTTNHSIFHESFYNDQIIKFIDKGDIVLNVDFIKNTYKNIDQFDEYSINKWVRKIFQNEQ